MKRFEKENNKFLIHTQFASEKKRDSTKDEQLTFLDALLMEIGTFSESTALESFLFREQYDSESLQYDILQNASSRTSNILVHIQNERMFEEMVWFATSYRRMLSVHDSERIHSKVLMFECSSIKGVWHRVCVLVLAILCSKERAFKDVLVQRQGSAHDLA